jgi:hypothetical protein
MGMTTIDFCDMMLLPCGGVAYYDEPRFGMNYYCAQCEAIVGSDNQPQACKDEEAKWHLQKLLGGAGWDYFKDLDEWD